MLQPRSAKVEAHFCIYQLYLGKWGFNMFQWSINNMYQHLSIFCYQHLSLCLSIFINMYQYLSIFIHIYQYSSIFIHIYQYLSMISHKDELFILWMVENPLHWNPSHASVSARKVIPLPGSWRWVNMGISMGISIGKWRFTLW